MTLNVSETMKVCMTHPGMWDDFLAGGRLDATGIYLQIGREAFDAINSKYFPNGGLGTWLHDVLLPTTQFVDRLLGTALVDCGGCAGRELTLNELTGPHD